MTKDEMIKNDRHKLMDLLYNLKQGELCTPECYGCCGDNERSFAYCPDAVKNFEKGLAELGYHKVSEDEIVVKKSVYDLEKAFYKEKCAEFDLLCYDYHKAKQETARDILQEVKTRGIIHKYEEYIEIDMDELKTLANKYGIDEED